MERMKLNIQLFGASGSISCTQQGSYNVANNTTVERITFTVTRTSGTTYWQSGTANFIINGQSYTASLALPSSQTSASCYVDVTVTHDADGSKYLTYSASINTNTSAGTISASSGKWLTTIPRASVPTLSANAVNVGQSVTINTNRASSSFTHILSYVAPGTSAASIIAQNVGASYTWDIPVTLLSYFSESDRGVFRIVCDTFNGNTVIGSNSVNLTIYARGAYDTPTYNLNIAEANQTVINSGIGLYLQNKSQIKISLSNISLCYDSPLASYQISIKDSGNNEVWGVTQTIPDSQNKATSLSVTTPVLTRSGTFTVSTSLYDKRGKYLTNTTTYTSTAYNPPTITQVSATRSNSSGVETPSGTYLKYTFVGSITSLNSKNSRRWEIGYKRKDSSGSYSYTTIDSSSYSISRTGYTLNLSLSSNYEYDIAFRATDTFGSTIIERSLGTDFKLINFNASGKSMAFGGISNRGSNEEYLDSYLAVNCLNGIYSNGTSVETLIENSVSPVRKLATDMSFQLADLGVTYLYNLTESGRSISTGSWIALASSNTITPVIPSGKYLIFFEGFLSATGNGIATFDPYIDGSRTDDRQSIPLGSGLITSTTCIVYKEFTTNATHTINLYAYTNASSTVSKTTIRFIRIG